MTLTITPLAKTDRVGVWTRGKPTQPGWYWAFVDSAIDWCEAVPVFVDGDGLIRTFGGGRYHSTVEGVEWFAPATVPSPPIVSPTPDQQRLIDMCVELADSKLGSEQWRAVWRREYIPAIMEGRLDIEEPNGATMRSCLEFSYETLRKLREKGAL